MQMLNEDDEILGIDKSSNFAARVIILSIPAGLLFLIFGLAQILPYTLAIGAYICVLFFNTVFLLPMSAELRQIKKYIQNLSAGVSEEQLLKNMTEKETRDLTEAINSMHKFWVDKTEMLENRTLSDAAVLDTLPEPLLMVNKNNTIIGANRATRQLLGGELLNKTVSDIITDNQFNSELSKVLTLETRSADLRLCLTELKNKPKFHIQITTIPWFAKGDVVAVISFYDLNKILQLEQMQQDFVANASHELRTPLSIISGFIETLQTSAKNDEAARDKFLSIISEQTTYMSALIEDLLSLSKIELTLDTPPEDKVNINQIIREINTAMSLKLSEHNLKVSTHFARLPQITADEHQITQVLQNLLDNAIKYATPDTEITITSEKVNEIPPHQYYEVSKGTAVKISVANHGIAISPNDIARLTERFYRLQEHKNKNIKGTGLGLSIASQIIKRHKGNLTITSEDDLTTFSIYLPINGK